MRDFRAEIATFREQDYVVVRDVLTGEDFRPVKQDLNDFLDRRYQRTGEPMGRPMHPDFPVRSRKAPASVTRDYESWCRAWEEGLENSRGVKLNRVKATL